MSVLLLGPISDEVFRISLSVGREKMFINAEFKIWIWKAVES
jgi:hypothetical protein